MDNDFYVGFNEIPQPSFSDTLSYIPKQFNHSELTDSNWFERTFDPSNVEMQFNAQQASKQRQFDMNEAQKQRQWEEYMSNTAFQRQARDMRAVGLNPALMYSQGGATTPTGATAHGVSASVGGNNNFTNLTNLVSSILGFAGKVLSAKMFSSKTTRKIGFGD